MKSKKLTNFIEDTKLYFKDKISRKKDALAKYTVVSACYNVSLYLDDFFRSMVKQTIGFRDNIFLIMVDDGSTDNTPEIIKKWVKKYPNNITYIHKENGGQATARNLGLKFVKTPWVTFTDPDDFLNDIYFENIDNFLKNSKERDNISIISTNMIFFYEKDNVYKDNHPLAFKYTNEHNVIPVDKLGKNVQLHASSCLFNFNLMQKHNITFPDIRPNFEDGYLLSQLMIKEKEKKLAFIKNSKYLYRKRVAGTSTLDGAWKDYRHYSDVFTKGYIPLLEMSVSNKSISNTIQNQVLYDLSWHVINLLNREEATDFLTKEQKDEYLKYMDTCFSYIDKSTIFSFNLNRIWRYQKLGILNCFKNEDPKMKPVVYVEKYDKFKDEILLRYFVASPCLEEFRVGCTEIIPSHTKWVRDTFVGRTFIFQRLVWLPLKNIEGVNLTCSINGEKAKISCQSVEKEDYSTSEIRKNFAKTVNDSPNGPWLIMDRMTDADDNAEHFYRFLSKTGMEQDVYFLLNKDSKDWSRLAGEGFNLVEFGSEQHRSLSKSCSKIISSQIDMFVTDFWKDNSLDNKQIIFLQHGVIKDDLSRWLNSKKRMDIFVTSTCAEFDSIVGNLNRYRCTDKETKLIGLTRHDSLLKDADSYKKKVIMIMPTWRASLASNRFGKVVLADDFEESLYFNSWKNFLCSDELKNLSQEYGYEVQFVPHPIMKTALRLWNLPSYIRLPLEADSSIQTMFKECAMMITDFSSVAFDVGYLGKPVLYYQFDEDTFWSQQVYQKGYFDYRKDGFGAVCNTQEELLIELEKLLKINCENVPGLQEKVDSTYRFRDGKNCERTLQAILDLDKPNPKQVNERIALDFVEKAIRFNNFALAINRAELLVADYPNNKSYKDLLSLLNAKDLLANCKLSEVEYLLSSITDLPEQFKELKNNTLAKFYIFTHQYDKAKELLESYELSTYEYSMLVWVYGKLGIKELPNKQIINNTEIYKEQEDVIIKYIYNKYVLNQQELILLNFKEVTESDNEKIFTDSTLKVMQFNIEVPKLKDSFLFAMISEAAINNSEWSIDGKFRTQIEKLEGRNNLWRALAAKRAFLDGRENYFNDVFSNLSNAYGDEIRYMTIDEFEMYLQASRDKFKPKAFNRMIEKIRYESIQNIKDFELKSTMEHSLMNYLDM
ncbi:MAG: CDP-glycerol glycerophosphotransferase family protein [Succinivibrionaceae bacterium]